MQNIVIDKPYVPVPPYDSKVWPAMLRLYIPRFLRKRYGIEKIECMNANRLRESIAAGHGVMITPNHSRDEDPFVLNALTNEVGTPFYIVASWHLFMQNRLLTFLLRRAGAFSIYREGMDRAALNSSIGILESASRPLVIFPEGHVSRTNDHINALMEGTAMIARSAAKKRAKDTPPGKVAVHPVAIRYSFQCDASAAASKVLDEIEARLTWRPSKEMPIVDRIHRIGAGLLALKELDYLGHTQEGTIPQRIESLINAVLNPLEDEWVESRHDGDVTSRVKRLRTAILPDMVKGDIDEKERQRRWRQLADVYLAQQLFHYPPDYVNANASPARIIETIERFEEDLTDKVRVHRPIHAKVMVGTAIEVTPARESRGGSDPLMVEIESQLREMLGITPSKEVEK